jgi:hypothetical protein
MVEQTPAELTSALAVEFPDNTSGFITPARLRRVMKDMIDSYVPLNNYHAPSITAFAVSGQSTSVSANTTLSGSKTFTYTLDNAASVSGTMTINQAGSPLSTNVSADQTSIELTINTVVVSAGQSVTFQLTGSDIRQSSFSRNFVISAPQDHEILYYGRSSSNNPAAVDLSGFTRSDITGSGQDITVSTGTTSQGDFFMIFVPTAEDLSTITDTALGTDVTSIFTRTADVRTINSENYTSYVVGPLNSGFNESYTVRIA